MPADQDGRHWQDCPRCGSADIWQETGPGDRPGNRSCRMHCEACGFVLKEDVPDGSPSRKAPPREAC